MSLNRRQFLIHSLAVAGTTAAARQMRGALPPSVPKAAPGSPNVLFILAEDIGPQLSCYGEPLIRTPHLDRLAARGTRFTHCFTTAPVCSASRSALMTGMYATSIGAHNHRTWPWRKQALPDGVFTLTDYFRAAGYFTCNCAPAQTKLRDPKTGERLPTAAAGSGKTDFNFVSEKPFDGFDWNQRSPGQPFFAQLTLNESHKGIGWPLARKTLGARCVPPERVKLPPYYPDHPVARDEYANYLDAIMLVDGYVGEIMARLEREGLATNTVVVFMGDNGQCLFRGKQFLYDGGIHVPLIVAWPDGRRAGDVDDRLVSGIDLTAILLGLAGIKPGPVMQGRNLLDPAVEPRQHVFAARDRMDVSTDRMRCVRTHRWKYIRNFLPMVPYMQHNAYKERSYPTWSLVKSLAKQGGLSPAASLFAADRKPIEELYDTRADPHEVNNLAADPAHAPRLRELRALVDDWTVRTGDRGATMEDPLDIYRGYWGRLPDEDEAARPNRGKQ